MRIFGAIKVGFESPPVSLSQATITVISRTDLNIKPDSLEQGRPFFFLVECLRSCGKQEIEFFLYLVHKNGVFEPLLRAFKIWCLLYCLMIICPPVVPVSKLKAISGSLTSARVSISNSPFYEVGLGMCCLLGLKVMSTCAQLTPVILLFYDALHIPLARIVCSSVSMLPIV